MIYMYVLTYKVMNRLAVSFIQELCASVAFVTTRDTLQSVAHYDIDTTDKMAFSGSTAWNSLPSDI